MVRYNGVYKTISLILFLCTIIISNPKAQDIELISHKIEAKSCDVRLADDDKKTAENRAIDKALTAGIKASKIIQKQNDKLSDHALNIIIYKLIDDHLSDITSTITNEDDKKVCVAVNANLKINKADLTTLIAEHNKELSVEQISSEVVEVAEKINNETSFKPENINEKKLLYINKMGFWNGNEDSHYTTYITELLEGSDYYFITEDENIADFVMTPLLTRSEVDKIDDNNHKMQMTLVLNTFAPNISDFEAISEQQNHFILFDAQKNDQEVADTLIRKLLKRAVSISRSKIERFVQKELEDNKVYGE